MKPREQFNVRILPELIEQVKQEAEKRDCTISRQVEYILQQHLAPQQSAGCNEKPGPSDHNKGE